MTNSRNTDKNEGQSVSLSENLPEPGLSEKDSSLSFDDLPADAQELASKPGRILFGDIGMRIAANGDWYYRGSIIGRKSLVKLFSTVVRCDDAGNYWMVTPVEMAPIQVDDAPFTAVELMTEGSGEDQVISFRTNVDAIVPLDEEHPLRVETDLETGEPRPYITVKERLEALIVRSVFYQLIEQGESLEVDGEDVWGVWSAGSFFPIGAVGDL